MHELHTLLTDLALGESPRWHAGRLWLCDWVAHEVLAVDLTGRREVMATIPSMPFCIERASTISLSTPFAAPGPAVVYLKQAGR